MARFDISIIIDQPQAKQAILQGLVDHLNRNVPKAEPRLKSRLQKIISDAVLQSAETAALTGAGLHGELGVQDPESAVKAVITALQNNISLVFVPFSVMGEGVSGGIKIGILRQDMSDVLTIPEARFVSEKSGIEIPWLKWLLVDGDAIVVDEFHFARGAYRTSRTGLGLMFKGGNFKVPSAYSGTVNDNWLTRALDAASPLVRIAVQEEVLRALR